MRSIARRRPSASLVVAILALVVAASGTAIAASAISGDKLIKKKSLSGNRLRDNTVTGKQIKESSLGKVPRAGKADSATTAASATNATNANTAVNATNAANASTVNGRSVTTFEKLVATNTTTAQTVVSIGGLTVTLACDASGQPTLEGVPSVDKALLRGAKVTVATSGQVGTSSTTANTPVTLLTPGDSRGEVTFEYATPSGSVVSVHTYVDDRVTLNNFDGCSASGSVVSG